MSSQRRIQSSRANGAKSRGPVTAAGRRNSSRNNLRHGLLAECVVLEDEKTEIFDDILADLTREFNPQTEAQRGLVETMAAARWRLFRIWNIERETLLSEIEKRDDGKRPESRPAAAFRALAEQSNVLDILHRYEVRFDRQYARALNLLLKLAAPESPLRRTGHPGPSAEGAHPAPQNDFCHSNPVPKSDTRSGVGLPACGTPAPHPGGTPVPHPGADAEGVSLSPTEPTRPETRAHAESTLLPDPRPLTPGPHSPALLPDPQPLTPALPQSQNFELSPQHSLTPVTQVTSPVDNCSLTPLSNQPAEYQDVTKLVGAPPAPLTPLTGAECRYIEKRRE
jgi:hypothetical protein